MGILPVLSILYALCAMSMATDAVAHAATHHDTPDLMKQKDATLSDHSKDVASDSPVENQEEEVMDALDGDDEVAETADKPVPAGFYEYEADAVAEEETALDELQKEDEALDHDADASESEESPADSPVPVEADSKAPIVKRVVGGSYISPTTWPWQVSLQYRSGSKYYHICGGFLVKRNWVLTAAHCVDRRRTYRVVAGEQDLNKENCREQYANVWRIYRHPSWNKRVAYGNDLALLRLSKYVTLNRYVKLATLPAYGAVLKHGTTCYITGWGRTSTRGKLSQRLRYAYMPIVNYRTCRNRYWWGSTVKNNMVCAGGTSRRSGCYGDSGGPLNCYANRRYEVHGITSFVSSRGCNIVRKPTVFTRVSAFMCWIRKYIG